MTHIFVFGSNLAGIHGAGSAKEAAQNHGAKYGVGSGRTGNAYAIPTKGHELEVLPLDTIKEYVDDFRRYARNHPELSFDVVKIGCGLAGYREDQIAPMFKGVSDNVNLPDGWRRCNSSGNGLSTPDLIKETRMAFAAYRGLGRDLINQMIGRLEQQLQTLIQYAAKQERLEAERDMAAQERDALREALERIGRMSIFPDDKINRTTLHAAIQIVRAALHPDQERDSK